MTKLGISGITARHFLTTQITPLLALVGVLLGIFAVIITPREEDPQINVTFANIFIAFPGATAGEVESLLATPAEQVISEISGIDHVQSAARKSGPSRRAWRDKIFCLYGRSSYARLRL